MAFNGSGTFVRLYDWTTDRDAGTKIRADRMDGEDDGFATGLSNCITKDGQTVVTANLPMATFKFTGLGAGSAATDSVNLRQVQANAYGYVASDTGSANAYVIAPSPAIAAYVAGQRFSFISANSSTGASTLNVNSLGVKAVEYQSAALTGAEIKATSLIVVEYDGTAFQMISPSNYIQTEKGGDIASANPLVIDTDGDYFDVTGTANFASMTVAADRQFTLQFDGVLTMTHHATNLDLPGEANVTTAAGDVAVFQSTGANTVQCIAYTKADGTAIVAAAGGGPSLGSDSVIRTNKDDIGENITFVAGGLYENGMSVGPITINNSYTVTVASGCRWVII